MKTVIIGGSGLIGKKLAALLVQAGHEVLAASPSTGVNAVTGEGLAAALAGAEVVVDVSNSPSFEDEAVMHFFQASTRNLLAAELASRVRHHVALSVVGSERLPESGYFRAKVAQEALIKASAVPYTLVRATQFFEFIGAIADVSSEGQTVRVSSALLQPIAADDVAAALARVACEAPLDDSCEIAGPQALPLDDLICRALRAGGDARKVVSDDEARYFGTRLNDQSLMPGAGVRLGTVTLDAWLARP
jgi:uncharacterized protein YbjT (DUF2867 family)